MAEKNFDIICYGDELPGILALIAAVEEYYALTGNLLHAALLIPGSINDGLGGHLVRGGLSYLDPPSLPDGIPQNDWIKHNTPVFYAEFLKRAAVKRIALDPNHACFALKQMLQTNLAARSRNIEVIENSRDIQVLPELGSSQMSGVLHPDGNIYRAKQFIDCTVNAALAQKASVPFDLGIGQEHCREGVGYIPELAVTLTFETTGLKVDDLVNKVKCWHRRFQDLHDNTAQQWLNYVTGHQAATYRADIAARSVEKSVDTAATLDYLDIYTKALSIAYHVWRNKPFCSEPGSTCFDSPNIAKLSHERLSWNALLFYVDAATAEQLAQNGAQPTAAMLDEIDAIARWLKAEFPGTTVKPAKELYIRHTGNIKGVNKPLSGQCLINGGVPSNQSLGRFGYAFDIRGCSSGATNPYQGKHKYNVGMQHALVKNPGNLAVVSPASGFTDFAWATGRIVEFNSIVGQGVGVAAAIAIYQQHPLSSISDARVHHELVNRGWLNPDGTTPEYEPLAVHA